MKILKNKFARVIVLIAIICAFTVSVEAASVSDLMHYAFQPVGKCLYVYGGGWNEEDTAAGIEAMQKGVSENWISFYNKYDENYDYKETRYMIHDGLDCTGYVGWCMYQLFEDTYSQNGYVYLAEEMAQKYSEIFNSEFISQNDISSRKCGDIMSSSGHAYIVVGECSDGSVVLLHASPPDIGLCGTATPSGSYDSEAIGLAEFYMNTFFNECYNKYPNCSRGSSYLESFDCMSWNTEILNDSDGYRELSAEEVLKDMFYETKVYINGERIAKDKPVYNVNYSNYVPVRVVSEKLGAEVKWYPGGKIDVKGENIDLTFNIDSDNAKINGRDAQLGNKVFLENDTAYVPLRFLCEAFGKSVSWDESKKAVYID